MARKLVRRLVAGTVVAAALTAMAPQANAACYRFIGPDGRVWNICI